MRAPLKPGRPLRGIRRLSPRHALPRLPPRLLRDQYLWYTAMLAPIAAITALADGNLDDMGAVFALSPVFIGFQALLGSIPSARRPLTDLGWSFLRLLVAFGFVAILVAMVGGPSRPIAALYLPVVVAAAAVGLTQGIVLGVLGTAIYLAPILGGPATAGGHRLTRGGARRRRGAARLRHAKDDAPAGRCRRNAAPGDRRRASSLPPNRRYGGGQPRPGRGRRHQPDPAAHPGGPIRTLRLPVWR